MCRTFACTTVSIVGVRGMRSACAGSRLRIARSFHVCMAHCSTRQRTCAQPLAISDTRCTVATYFVTNIQTRQGLCACAARNGCDSRQSAARWRSRVQKGQTLARTAAQCTCQPCSPYISSGAQGVTLIQHQENLALSCTLWMLHDRIV